MPWLMRSISACHCAAPGCWKGDQPTSHPFRTQNGIVDFQQDHFFVCIGCGYKCVPAAVQNPQFNTTSPSGCKRFLGRIRVSRGLEPACIKSCPTGAAFGTKDD